MFFSVMSLICARDKVEMILKLTIYAGFDILIKLPVTSSM